MSKLKLELEALKVESFRTTAGPAGDAGTVRAHGGGLVEAEEEAVAITTPPRTNDPSCFDTCRASCYGTCGEASCLGSCYSCPIGCTDGCTVRTCPSGGDVCCV